MCRGRRLCFRLGTANATRTVHQWIFGCCRNAPSIRTAPAPAIAGRGDYRRIGRGMISETTSSSQCKSLPIVDASLSGTHGSTRPANAPIRSRGSVMLVATDKHSSLLLTLDNYINSAYAYHAEEYGLVAQTLHLYHPIPELYHRYRQSKLPAPHKLRLDHTRPPSPMVLPTSAVHIPLAALSTTKPSRQHHFSLYNSHTLSYKFYRHSFSHQ